MLEAKKREGESEEGLMRRFNRRVQQSGIIIRARKSRFFEREKSDNLKKRAALRRIESKKKREEEKRFGNYYSGRR